MARISISEAARLGIDLWTMTASRLTLQPRPLKDRVRKDHALEAVPPGSDVSKAPRRTPRPATVGPTPRRSGARHAIGCGEPFEVSFFVPGPPSTKQRARTSMPKDKIDRAFAMAKGYPSAFKRLMGDVRHQTFTPTETRRYEALVGRVAAAAMRSLPPYDAPVSMEVICTFEGDGQTWPTGSGDPDIDNVEKAVMDALKGIVWSDDRLVVAKRSSKSCGPAAGVLVVVRDATAVNAAG